jgi:hypothetical protein
VLTNQPGKAKLIREQPFSLAYEIFRQRLLTANQLADRRHLPPRCGRLCDAAHGVEGPERAAAVRMNGATIASNLADATP